MTKHLAVCDPDALWTLQYVTWMIHDIVYIIWMT